MFQIYVRLFHNRLAHSDWMTLTKNNFKCMENLIMTALKMHKN